MANPGFPRRGGGGAGAAPTPEFGAKSIITARKRNLEQGNIFAPVCHSVHRGLSVPGGCLPAPGGGGVSAPGGSLVPGGCLVQTPLPGRLLLRVVRILLECILVWQDYCGKPHENERQWTERGVSLPPPCIRQCYCLLNQKF